MSASGPGEINAETIRRAVEFCAQRRKRAMLINLHLDRYPQFVGAAVEDSCWGLPVRGFQVVENARDREAAVIVSSGDLRAQRDGARAKSRGDHQCCPSNRQSTRQRDLPSTSQTSRLACARIRAALQMFDEKKLRAGKFGGILAEGRECARRVSSSSSIAAVLQRMRPRTCGKSRNV